DSCCHSQHSLKSRSTPAHLLAFFSLAGGADIRYHPLSLPDALPILYVAFGARSAAGSKVTVLTLAPYDVLPATDTFAAVFTTNRTEAPRPNSRHVGISYADYCTPEAPDDGHITVTVGAARSDPRPPV